MTVKVSTATETVWAVASLVSQSSFIVRKICEICVRYFCWLFTTIAVYVARRDDRVSWRSTCVIYTSVNCSFREQRFVNIACMELCHFWEIVSSPWLKVGRWASDVGGTVGFS